MTIKVFRNSARCTNEDTFELQPEAKETESWRKRVEQGTDASSAHSGHAEEAGDAGE